MKIYTRKGDKGRSLAVDGRRLSKSHIVFELEGHLDSLNCHIGLILSHESFSDDLLSVLRMIQHHIFDIGAHFWMETGKDYIKQEQIDFLEEQIDLLSTEIKPLTRFILPGGAMLAALCHIARTECRKCERIMVKFHETEKNIHPLALAYINRLSDFLFVLARFSNKDGCEPFYESTPDF